MKVMTIRMRVLLKMPVLLKMRGRVSSPPPSMLFSIARIVALDLLVPAIDL